MFTKLVTLLTALNLGVGSVPHAPVVPAPDPITEASVTEPVKAITPDVLHSILWVGNAVQTMGALENQSKVAAAAALLMFVKVHPEASSAKLIEFCMQAEAEYSEKVRALDIKIAPQNAAEAANLMLHTLAQSTNEDFRSILSKGPEVLRLGAEGLEQDLLAADRFHEHLWDDLYKLARGSKQFEEAVNMAFGKVLKIKVSDSIHQILDQNAEIRKRLEQVLKTGDDLSKIDFHGNVVVAIDGVHEAFKSFLNKDVNAKASLAISILGDAEKAERLLKHLKNSDQFFDGARASLVVLSKIAAVFNKKTAGTIANVGGSAIQVGQSIVKIVAIAKKLKGVVNIGSSILMGNVAGGAMNLVSMLGGSALGGGDDQNKVVLEQLSALQSQLTEMQHVMNERFDHIDQTLNTILDTLNRNFDTIIRDQRNILASLGEIQASLATLDRNTQNYVRAAAMRPFNKDLVECLGYHHDFPGMKMSADKFTGCHAVFKSYAINDSRDPLSTTPVTPSQLFNDTYLAELFADARKGNVINVVAQLGNTRFHNRRLHGNLPNPVEWATGTEAFLRLLDDNWQDYAHLTSKDQLNDILAVGEQLRQFIRNMSMMPVTLSGVPGMAPDYEFWNKLVDNYRERLEAFRADVARMQAEFEAEHRDRLGGYLLWGNHSAAGLSPDFLGHGLPSCKAGEPTIWRGEPQEYWGLIDESYKVAQRMKLGQIHVCYNDLGWTNTRHMELRLPTDTGGCTLLGEADLSSITVSVEARFLPNDGAEKRIFKRSVWSVGNAEGTRHLRNWITKAEYTRVECPKGVKPPAGYEVQRDGHTLVTRRPAPHLNGGGTEYCPDLACAVNEINNYFKQDQNGTAQSREDNLRSRLLRSSPVTEAERQQAAHTGFEEARFDHASEMAQLIEKRFSDERLQFRDRPFSERQRSPLFKKHVDGLSAAHAILQSFAALGLSKSLQNHDEFRSLLYGDERILGGEEIFDALSQVGDAKADKTLEFLRDLQDAKSSTLAKRVDGLRNSIHAVLSESHGDEPLALVESTMRKLELYRLTLEAQAPSKGSP